MTRLPVRLLTGMVSLLLSAWLATSISSNWLWWAILLIGALVAGLVIDHWSGPLLTLATIWVLIGVEAWWNHDPGEPWQVWLPWHMDEDYTQIVIGQVFIPIVAVALLGGTLRRTLRRRRART